MGARQSVMRPVDLLVLECIELERQAYARLAESVIVMAGATAPDPARLRVMTSTAARSNAAFSSTVSVARRDCTGVADISASQHPE